MTTETTIAAMTELLTRTGYGWVAADLADPAVGHGFPPPESAREYYGQIVHYIDGKQAPGSETPLLGDALDADGFDRDPVACLAWWLDAYRAWELAADRDEATQERVYDEIFSGDSASALRMATA